MSVIASGSDGGKFVLGKEISEESEYTTSPLDETFDLTRPARDSLPFRREFTVKENSTSRVHAILLEARVSGSGSTGDSRWDRFFGVTSGVPASCNGGDLISFSYLRMLTQSCSYV